MAKPPLNDDFIPTDDNFAALVRGAEDGVLINELGAELRAAIKHLRQHAGKTNKRAKGVLTLKIKLEADGKDILEHETEFTTKLPKLGRPISVNWVDEEGNILKGRPQKQLDLRDVSAPAATVTPIGAKDVAAPAPKAM